MLRELQKINFLPPGYVPGEIISINQAVTLAAIPRLFKENILPFCEELQKLTEEDYKQIDSVPTDYSEYWPPNEMNHFVSMFAKHVKQQKRTLHREFREFYPEDPNQIISLDLFSTKIRCFAQLVPLIEKHMVTLRQKPEKFQVDFFYNILFNHLYLKNTLRSRVYDCFYLEDNPPPQIYKIVDSALYNPITRLEESLRGLQLMYLKSKDINDETRRLPRYVQETLIQNITSPLLYTKREAIHELLIIILHFHKERISRDGEISSNDLRNEISKAFFSGLHSNLLNFFKEKIKNKLFETAPAIQRTIIAEWLAIIYSDNSETQAHYQSIAKICYASLSEEEKTTFVFIFIGNQHDGMLIHPHKEVLHKKPLPPTKVEFIPRKSSTIALNLSSNLKTAKELYKGGISDLCQALEQNRSSLNILWFGSDKNVYSLFGKEELDALITDCLSLFTQNPEEIQVLYRETKTITAETRSKSEFAFSADLFCALKRIIDNQMHQVEELSEPHQVQLFHKVTQIYLKLQCALGNGKTDERASQQLRWFISPSLEETLTTYCTGFRLAHIAYQKNLSYGNGYVKRSLANYSCTEFLHIVAEHKSDPAILKNWRAEIKEALSLYLNQITNQITEDGNQPTRKIKDKRFRDDLLNIRMRSNFHPPEKEISWDFPKKIHYLLFYKWLAFTYVENERAYQHYLDSSETLYNRLNEEEKTRVPDIKVAVGDIEIALHPKNHLPPRNVILRTLGATALTNETTQTSSSRKPKTWSSWVSSATVSFLSSSFGTMDPSSMFDVLISHPEEETLTESEKELSKLLNARSTCITNRETNAIAISLLELSATKKDSSPRTKETTTNDIRNKTVVIAKLFENNVGLIDERIDFEFYAHLFLSILYERSKTELAQLGSLPAQEQQRFCNKNEFSNECFKKAQAIFKAFPSQRQERIQNYPLHILGIPLRLNPWERTRPDEIINRSKQRQAPLAAESLPEPMPLIDLSPVNKPQEVEEAIVDPFSIKGTQPLPLIPSPSHEAPKPPSATLFKNLKSAIIAGIQDYQTANASFSLFHGKAGRDRANELLEKTRTATDFDRLAKALKKSLKRPEHYISVCGFSFWKHQGQVRTDSLDTKILEAIAKQPNLLKELNIEKRFPLKKKEERKEARKSLVQAL